MSEPAASPVDVVVTVDEAHLPHLQEIASQLKAKGLQQAQALTSAGLVTGKAPSKTLEALRGVTGVAAVEAAGDVQIAPPDSDVQ